MFRVLRSWRRRRIAARPLPPAWRAILERRYPFVRDLPDDERARFMKHVLVFVLDKDWVGVEGLIVTDEMKVVVAGAAARLARNLSFDVYDDLGTVILHPGAIETHDEGSVVGQAHWLGAVSLAWDTVQDGIADPHDGHDVALHELAHVLDGASGEFDGTPVLARQAEVRAWARAFSAAFLRLHAAERPTVLDKYGAKNEAEMFAVATETFFEKPRQLRAAEPAVYAALAAFYRVDPAAA